MIFEAIILAVVAIEFCYIFREAIKGVVQKFKDLKLIAEYEKQNSKK